MVGPSAIRARRRNCRIDVGKLLGIAGVCQKASEFVFVGLPRKQKIGVKHSQAELHAVPFTRVQVSRYTLEKAHFAAWKRGPENRKNKVKLPPPSVPPPEALYEFLGSTVTFWNRRGMPTILGMNFWGGGGGLKPWRNKAEKIAEKTRWRTSLRNSPAIFQNSPGQIEKFTPNPLCRAFFLGGEGGSSRTLFSAFLKHAFREVTSGFCKGTVPGAPSLPSPGPLRMPKK